MYPLKCIVSEAWSSSASWQPRWVGIAPAENEILRLTRGENHEQKPQHQVFSVAGMLLQMDMSVLFLQKLEDI